MMANQKSLQASKRSVWKMTSSAGLALLAVAVLLTTPGCMGAMAQMLYVIKGHEVPAAYGGMEGKRIAVVCISDASAYGPDTMSYTVSKAISMKLATSVKKAEVISAAKVESWIDENGWNEIDFTELGKGVGAEIVLAVEIGGYSIREGSTMFKGRSDISATVYDISDGGKVAYVHGPKHYQFPTNGRPAIQTTERQFEAVYLAKLTEHIASQFHKHDPNQNVAQDASLLNY